MDYLKQKIKWILSVLGILGVAFAYEMSPTTPPMEQPIIPLEIITNPASIPTETITTSTENLLGGETITEQPVVATTFTDNGKTIEIDYKDLNTDKDFPIKGQSETVSGWDWAEYIFSIENKTAIDSLGKIRIYGVDVLEIRELKKDILYTIEVNDYGKKTYTCGTDWITEKENQFGIINYSCDKEIKHCDVLNKTECTVDNDLLGAHQETKYKDEWQGLILSTSTDVLKTSLVPSKYTAEKENSYLLIAGKLQFFKVRFKVQPKTSGEFLIEWENNIKSSVLR